MYQVCTKRALQRAGCEFHPRTGSHASCWRVGLTAAAWTFVDGDRNCGIEPDLLRDRSLLVTEVIPALQCRSVHHPQRVDGRAHRPVGHRTECGWLRRAPLGQSAAVEFRRHRGRSRAGPPVRLRRATMVCLRPRTRDAQPRRERCWTADEPRGARVGHQRATTATARFRGRRRPRGARRRRRDGRA